MQNDKANIFTKGGHPVKNFTKLSEPIIIYSTTEMIYSGTVKNDYTKNWQECHWDKDGQVINRNVAKYDIDLSKIEI